MSLKLLLRPNSRQKAATRHDCMHWAIYHHGSDADPYQILATAQIYEEYILDGRAAQRRK